MNIDVLNVVAVVLKKLCHIGFYIVLAMGTATLVSAQEKTLQTVEKVELAKYLGVWYEIVRKPSSLEKKCSRDISTSYTLNEYANMLVEHRCYDANNQLIQFDGEAYAVNEPWYSKFKVSFLPDGIRWLPVGQRDYWVLKLDEAYQMVLIGEPDRKSLWLLARDPHPDQALVKQYLDYAKSMGFQLNNLIYTPHSN